MSFRGCGRLFCRFCLVVLDYDSSFGCSFFLLFASLYVLSETILPAATCFGFFAGRVVAVDEIACCVVSAAGVSGCCCCCCCCSFDIVPMQMLRLTLNSRLLVAQKLLKIVVHLFSSCCALLRNFFSLWLSSSRSKINVLFGDQRHVGQSEKPPHFKARLPARFESSLLMM